MSTRVYVPHHAGRLRAVVTADGIGPAPFVAHAVTPEVRAELPDVDEEECEYAASTAAARSSLAAAPDDGAGPPRGDRRRRALRPTPRAPWTRPSWRSTTSCPSRYVGAVLADAADAEPDVVAARDALAARSEDAEVLAERCLDHELGWWAAQEIGDLLAGTGVV